MCSMKNFSYRKCINQLLRDDWSASLPRMLELRSLVARIVAAPDAGPSEVSENIIHLKYLVFRNGLAKQTNPWFS